VATSEPVRCSAETACDVCGRFGAFVFEGRELCEECFAVAGTCGGGGEDKAKSP